MKISNNEIALMLITVRINKEKSEKERGYR
jgi:hypothetical protein